MWPAKHIAQAIEISASPYRVWEIIAALESWPDWTPTVDRLELLDPGALHVGQRARLAQLGLRPAVWQVTTLDPGTAFNWRTRSAGM
jgi:hypothetical protein